MHTFLSDSPEHFCSLSLFFFHIQTSNECFDSFCPQKITLQQEKDYVRSNPSLANHSTETISHDLWLTAAQHIGLESQLLTSCDINHPDGRFSQNMDIE